MATAEALGAADACWQAVSGFRFVFMRPAFWEVGETPGSSHRPPPHVKALQFKDDKCHPGSQPSLKPCQGGQGGGQGIEGA